MLMPYAQTEHNGQAALWVTNGFACMSKAITRYSKPMGVDNEENTGKKDFKTVTVPNKKKIPTQFTLQKSHFWS